MFGSIISASGKAFLDTFRERDTARDIESNLNQQLAGESWDLDGYSGKTVELEIESISVRPKYRPEKHGVARRVEVENSFCEYAAERETTTYRERFVAILNDRWVTKIRVKLNEGDAGDLEPEGANLHYLTSTRSVRYDGYQEREGVFPVPAIRVAKTHDLQSDKLEIKTGFDGSVGEYRSRVNDAFSLLQDVQSNMDARVMAQLMDLYYSSRTQSEDGFTWRSEEQARQIGQFLFDDDDIDTEQLAATLSLLHGSASDSGLGDSYSESPEVDYGS